MFISYAQNFEDVMLWRALKHVEKGFYIDIGAQDPVIDSVSLAFYEQGWRGIHVEPVSYYAEKIRNARPGETVIQAAVGTGSGVLSFFEIVDTGLSTGDAQIAERHAKEGFAVRETVVPCISLGDILDKYQDRDIHWLKIDVEGMEEEVLQSWQRSAVRPWVVAVESTLPNTQIETHQQWESLLISLGYDFVYFDGLNRFYVSQNKPELKVSFNSSPNVFDGFVLSGTSSGPFCSLLNNKQNQTEQALNAQLESCRQELQRLYEALAEREQKERELSAQLESGRQDLQRLYEALAEREQKERDLNAQLESGRQELQRLNEVLAEGEREINSARLKIDELNGHAHHLWTMAENLNNDLQTVFASSSWRVTAPIRFTVRSVKWFGSRAWAWLTLKPGSRPRRIAKKIIRRGILAIEVRPGLKQRIVAGAYRLGRYSMLRRFYHRLVVQSVSTFAEESASHAPGGIATGYDLTPWTRQMALRLEAARAGIEREVQ